MQKLCKCCDPLNLGCFYHNEAIVFPMVATEAGDYRFMFESPLGGFYEDIDHEIGQNLQIPADIQLNENMTYSLSIIKPSDEYVTYADHLCFDFTVTINTKKCNDSDYHYASDSY